MPTKYAGFIMSIPTASGPAPTILTCIPNYSINYIGVTSVPVSTLSYGLLTDTLIDVTSTLVRDTSTIVFT